MKWFLVWSALLAPLTELSAQRRLDAATLTGVVRHDSSGAPLAAVEVLLNNTPHRAETNTQGRYLFASIPAGSYVVIYRKVGHLPARSDVRLVAGDTVRVNVTMIESVVELSPVTVTGNPRTTRGVGIGREAFEERRRLGFGKFFDSVELRRSEGHLGLNDLLRRHTNLELHRIRFNGFSMWVAFNARERDPLSGQPICVLDVCYDGIKMGRGGRMNRINAGGVDPIDLSTFSLMSLENVEVYRSAAEVPMEYGGASAACGVILLWSRRGP
jgi:hypothetical protein